MADEFAAKLEPLIRRNHVRRNLVADARQKTEQCLLAGQHKVKEQVLARAEQSERSQKSGE